MSSTQYARYTGLIAAQALSVGPFGSSPNADGLSLVNDVLTLEPADGTHPGALSTTTQTIAGAKTFSTSVATPSLLLNGASAGSLTLTVPASVTSYAISWPSAQSAGTGYLQNDGSGNLSWAAGTGGSGVNAIGTIDGNGASANGLSIVGGLTLYAQSASGTNPGMVNTTTQTFAGNKTFSGSISASNLSGTNTGDQTITLTGDVTGSGTGSFAATIAANAVTNSKLAQMTTLTIKGNNTGLTADPLDLSVSQVKTMLNLTGTNSGDVTLTAVGAVPNANGASLSGQALTLQPADGTNPGLVTAGTQTIGGNKTFSGSISASNLSGSNTGDQTITLTGDVTGSGTGSFAATIAANAVTNSKLAQIATQTFKGRTTAGTGNVEDLTATQATAMLNAMVGDSGSGGTKGLVPAPAAGDSAHFLRGDGAWASANSNLNVVSKTTTYSAATTDDLILCSGSAFTVTLYTAVGNSGRQIRIKKTDSSTSNIITIATTSAQTIDGASSVTLNIQYQDITLVSDGSNWQILAKYVPTVAARYTTTATVAGTSVTVMKYTVSDYDTTSSYNTTTGLFTCPISGKYRVTGGILWAASGSTATDGKINLFVQKNSTTQAEVGSWTSQIAAPNFDGEIQGASTVSCAAGDTLNIGANRSSALTYSAQSSSTGDYIVIERVGD